MNATARQRWNELTPRTRRILVVGGLVDSALRTSALVDLARRPADQVRGSRKLWAVVLAVVSSLGVLPAAYFTLGRRRKAADG